MASWQRLTRCGLVGAAGLVLAAACATALPPLSPPKTLQPGDLRSLAGQWEGSATGNVGPAPFMGSAFHSVQLTLAEDGTFRSVVDGKLGFTGGVGMGVEWDTGSSGMPPWRETHF